ncbi:MAG: MFS transporter [Chloroflexota bacterium]|nr:MAG: MFS transporter [Chloroflexota bacterium]
MISRTPELSSTCDGTRSVTIGGMDSPTRWRDLFQHGRGRLTTGILLVEFLVAVEALVVIAIMPAARRDLGGVEFYGLVFAGFSLAGLVLSPIAGRAADRGGPAQPFLLFGSLFIVGTALCGLAPSMPLLTIARLLQGAGAGGAYTVALAAVTRIYPESGRARVLALLAGAWIVPGLLGPSYGALIASTLGWRWAFLSIIPLTVVAIALTLPALRALPPVEQPATLSIRWPLQLAVGVTGLISGLSLLSWISLPLIAVGVVLTIAALGHILPPGSLHAHRGAPAAVMITFLLLLGFTLGTVSWSIGNWWQSRAIVKTSSVTLMRLGGAILTVAIIGIMATLLGAPLAISYVAWFAAGFGMGIAYPTAYLVILRGGDAGGSGSAVSSQQVAERLALALGGGLGGACVALAAGMHASLATGLAGAFALALLSAAASFALAPRLTESG